MDSEDNLKYTSQDPNKSQTIPRYNKRGVCSFCGNTALSYPHHIGCAICHREICMECSISGFCPNDYEQLSSIDKHQILEKKYEIESAKIKSSINGKYTLISVILSVIILIILKQYIYIALTCFILFLIYFIIILIPYSNKCNQFEEMNKEIRTKYQKLNVASIEKVNFIHSPFSLSRGISYSSIKENDTFKQFMPSYQCWFCGIHIFKGNGRNFGNKRRCMVCDIPICMDCIEDHLCPTHYNQCSSEELKRINKIENLILFWYMIPMILFLIYVFSVLNHIIKITFDDVIIIIILLLVDQTFVFITGIYFWKKTFKTIFENKEKIFIT